MKNTIFYICALFFLAVGQNSQAGILPDDVYDYLAQNVFGRDCDAYKGTGKTDLFPFEKDNLQTLLKNVRHDSMNKVLTCGKNSNELGKLISDFQKITAFSREDAHFFAMLSSMSSEIDCLKANLPDENFEIEDQKIQDIGNQVFVAEPVSKKKLEIDQILNNYFDAKIEYEKSLFANANCLRYSELITAEVKKLSPACREQKKTLIRLLAAEEEIPLFDDARIEKKLRLIKPDLSGKTKSEQIRQAKDFLKKAYREIRKESNEAKKYFKEKMNQPHTLNRAEKVEIMNRGGLGFDESLLRMELQEEKMKMFLNQNLVVMVDKETKQPRLARLTSDKIESDNRAAIEYGEMVIRQNKADLCALDQKYISGEAGLDKAVTILGVGSTVLGLGLARGGLKVGRAAFATTAGGRLGVFTSLVRNSPNARVAKKIGLIAALGTVSIESIVAKCGVVKFSQQMEKSNTFRIPDPPDKVQYAPSYVDQKAHFVAACQTKNFESKAVENCLTEVIKTASKPVGKTSDLIEVSTGLTE